MNFLEKLNFNAPYYEKMKPILVAPYENFQDTYIDDWKSRTEHLLECSTKVIYAGKKRTLNYYERAIKKTINCSDTILAYTDLKIETKLTTLLKQAKADGKEVINIKI